MQTELSTLEVLKTAKEYAERFTGDTRRPVGAAIVTFDPYRLVFGTNFYPDPDKASETKEHIRHAEVDVLLTAKTYGFDLGQSILYVTKAPCLDCAKMMVAAGVDTVVMASPDPSSRWYESQLEGVKYLRDHKVAVDRATALGDIIRDFEQFESEQSGAR